MVVYYHDGDLELQQGLISRPSELAVSTCNMMSATNKPPLLLACICRAHSAWTPLFPVVFVSAHTRHSCANSLSVGLHYSSLSLMSSASLTKSLDYYTS